MTLVLDQPLAPVVRTVGSQVIANSRDVAAYFDKEHKNVLRDIDAIMSQSEPELKIERWFMQTEYLGGGGANGAIRARRAFDMTRDGFTLLAMGFTGEKALGWKLRYIEAFNAMEAALCAPAERAESVDVEALLSACREVRLTHGQRAARRFWRDSPLVSLFDPRDMRSEDGRASFDPIDIACIFISTRCVVTGEYADRVRSRDLIQAFCSWAAAAGHGVIGKRASYVRFSRLSQRYRDPDTDAMFTSCKASDMFYCGIRLL